MHMGTMSWHAAVAVVASLGGAPATGTGADATLLSLVSWADPALLLSMSQSSSSSSESASCLPAPAAAHIGTNCPVFRWNTSVVIPQDGGTVQPQIESPIFALRVNVSTASDVLLSDVTLQQAHASTRRLPI